MIAIVQPFAVMVKGERRTVLAIGLTNKGEILLLLAGAPPELAFLNAVEEAWPIPWGQKGRDD